MIMHRLLTFFAAALAAITLMVLAGTPASAITDPPTIPDVTVTSAPDEADATPTPTADVVYENCDAARAAGAAPLLADQPGYTAELDGDGDGIACEDTTEPTITPISADPVDIDTPDTPLLITPAAMAIPVVVIPAYTG